jgi:hypothetical protein
MEIHFEGFGRSLRNSVEVTKKKDAAVDVIPLV